jgi:hypothetical protein
LVVEKAPAFRTHRVDYPLPSRSPVLLGDRGVHLFVDLGLQRCCGPFQFSCNVHSVVPIAAFLIVAFIVIVIVIIVAFIVVVVEVVVATGFVLLVALIVAFA